jgi:hypothetical protein
MLVTEINLRITQDNYRLKSGYTCVLRFWSPKNQRWAELPFASRNNAEEFKKAITGERRVERKPHLVILPGRVAFYMHCPGCLKPTLS